MENKIKVAIIGAASIVAGKLISLLIGHKYVEIKHLVSETLGDNSLVKTHRFLKNILEIDSSEYNLDKIKEECDLVFISKPHGESAKFASDLYGHVKIIDLSADFRIHEKQIFENWYKLTHTAPNLLDSAIYGLPEIRKEKIKNSKLVANPGCYATSIILGLAPIVYSGIIESKTAIINSVSGVSGAGKTLRDQNMFVNINQNIKPYNIGIHRHTPEIEQEINELSGETGEFKILLVPHVAGFEYGIISTIFIKLSQDDTKITEKTIFEVFAKYYKNSYFVRIHEPGDLPELKDTVGTNFCDIGFKIDTRTNTLIITSVIDNLIKGAAGQAVQNMNIIFGFDEKEGLPF